MTKRLMRFVAIMIAMISVLGMLACGTPEQGEENGPTDEPVQEETGGGPEHVHTFSSIWSKDGSYHYRVCVAGNNCKEISDKAKHSYGEGVVILKAKKGVPGKKKYICTVCSHNEEREYTLSVPTAAQVYSARQEAIASAVEGYDFKFTLEGNLSLLGLGPSVSGVYEGKYRANQNTGEEQFVRKTSGALFFDNTEYSYTKNSQKIKLTVDKNNVVKKSSILRADEEDGFFINKVVVGLVNLLKEQNINDIALADATSSYDYKATIDVGANNEYLAKITSLLSNFGTKIAFKNVQFTNLEAIPFNFTIADDGSLDDFAVELALTIKIKGVKATISVKYEQENSNKNINIPTSDIITSNTQISNILSKINSKLQELKNNKAYSLDLTARNEFDPAWNKLAIVDEYKGRLYKNTEDSSVWFNHSYKYKAHHEEDGKETYKYTIGNTKDGAVYHISRKGSNVVTEVNNITVDTQFDYMTSSFKFTTNNIDCIKSVVDKTQTMYYIYLNDNSAINIQNKILEIVNSNNTDGVVKVDNYINNIVNIKDAEFKIVFEKDELVEISIITDLKYNPIAGEFTDYNITLTNELQLLINDKLSKAQDYKAPKKPDSLLGGLEFIL